MGRTAASLIDSYIPMSEPGFLVLISLLEPNHGYGIMREISERSNGRINIGTSTIYTILYKMEQDGLLEISGEVDRRKVYSITSDGRKVLEAEAQRLMALSDYAAFKLYGKERDRQTAM